MEYGQGFPISGGAGLGRGWSGQTLFFSSYNIWMGLVALPSNNEADILEPLLASILPGPGRQRTDYKNSLSLLIFKRKIKKKKRWKTEHGRDYCITRKHFCEI